MDRIALPGPIGPQPSLARSAMQAQAIATRCANALSLSEFERSSKMRVSSVGWKGSIASSLVGSSTDAIPALCSSPSSVRNRLHGGQHSLEAPVGAALRREVRIGRFERVAGVVGKPVGVLQAASVVDLLSGISCRRIVPFGYQDKWQPHGCKQAWCSAFGCATLLKRLRRKIQTASSPDGGGAGGLNLPPAPLLGGYEASGRIKGEGFAPCSLRSARPLTRPPAGTPSAAPQMGREKSGFAGKGP